MKKLLSVILAIIMTLSVFSCVSVYAVEDVTEPSDNVVDDTPELPDKLVLDSVINVPGGVEVKWSGVIGAKGYNVYRRAAGEPKATIIATTEDLAYVDKNVTHCGYYKYSVKAVFDGVEGAETDGILIKYLEAPKVTSVSAVVGGIQVSWTPVKNVDKYEIYYRTAGSDQWVLYARINSIHKTAFCRYVESGVYYRFAVVARSGNYIGGIDKTGPVIRYFEIPKLKNILAEATGLKISWTAVEKADGYAVYRRAAGEKYYTYLDTVTATTYFDETIPSGMTYKYVVKSVFGTAKSGYDANGLVSYFIAAPKLIGIASGSNGVYLKWELVDGASTYDIYRRGAGETTYKRIGSTFGGNGEYGQYKDTNGVIVGQYYRYIIRACNPYGRDSVFSTTSLVTRFMPTGRMDAATAFRFYSYAAQKAYQSAPGYTIKMWQNIKYSKVTCSDRALQKEFEEVFNSNYYTASKPFEETTQKNSNVSKSYFPYCSNYIRNIKSGTSEKKGNNYVVTLVFPDEYSPDIYRYNDSYSGIADVTNTYFNFNRAVKEMQDAGVIYQGQTKSLYKGFTIVAEITPDGKIVNMTHFCDEIYIKVDISMSFGYGPLIDYNASLGNYVTYSNFVY